MTVVLFLAHRLRRRPSSKTTSGQRILFAGVTIHCVYSLTGNSDCATNYSDIMDITWALILPLRSCPSRFPRPRDPQSHRRLLRFVICKSFSIILKLLTQRGNYKTHRNITIVGIGSLMVNSLNWILNSTWHKHSSTEGLISGGSILIPADTRSSHNAGLMLVQRRRRWTNINPALGKRIVHAVSSVQVCVHLYVMSRYFCY